MWPWESMIQDDYRRTLSLTLSLCISAWPCLQLTLRVICPNMTQLCNGQITLSTWISLKMPIPCHSPFYQPSMAASSFLYCCLVFVPGQAGILVQLILSLGGFGFKSLTYLKICPMSVSFKWLSAHILFNTIVQLYWNCNECSKRRQSQTKFWGTLQI